MRKNPLKINSEFFLTQFLLKNHYNTTQYSYQSNAIRKLQQTFKIIQKIHQHKINFVQQKKILQKIIFLLKKQKKIHQLKFSTKFT